jgi:hypothetical protein
MATTELMCFDEVGEVPRWFGGRNSSLSEWGEYEAVNSWTFERDMTEPPERPKRCYGDSDIYRIRVKLIVNISGKHRYGARCIPTHWTACLEWGRLKTGYAKGWHGSCRSVAGALRMADALPLAKSVRELQRRLYDKGQHDCVYELKDGAYAPAFTDLCLWQRDESGRVGRRLFRQHGRGAHAAVVTSVRRRRTRGGRE